MSKIQPPKGYITATEVKHRLNISDAMIRYYVQKEKIKYLVPPGRKQGFYLEKDVNNLSNELNAFIHMEDEYEEKANFFLSEESGLIKIAKTANIVFPSHEIPSNLKGNRPFIMNINESGSPVSRQYKQALQESGALNNKKQKQSSPQHKSNEKTSV